MDDFDFGADFDSLLDDTDDDAGISFDDQDNSQDNQLDNQQDDYFELSDSQQAENKSVITKQAMIIAIIGVLVILLVIAVPKMIRGNRNKQPAQSVQTSSQNASQANNQNQQVISNSSSRGSWTKLDSAPSIEFGQPIEAKFTITGIAHYAQKSDTQGGMQLTTVLTGGVSGFTGTYEIEVPYSKGRLLNIGNSFDVQVCVGDYKGNMVVGEISY